MVLVLITHQIPLTVLMLILLYMLSGLAQQLKALLLCQHLLEMAIPSRVGQLTKMPQAEPKDNTLLLVM